MGVLALPGRERVAYHPPLLYIHLIKLSFWHGTPFLLLLIDEHRPTTRKRLEKTCAPSSSLTHTVSLSIPRMRLGPILGQVDMGGTQKHWRGCCRRRHTAHRLWTQRQNALSAIWRHGLNHRPHYRLTESACTRRVMGVLGRRVTQT